MAMKPLGDLPPIDLGVRGGGGPVVRSEPVLIESRHCETHSTYGGGKMESVVVVSIVDQFGGDLVTQVFSSQEKADHWLDKYVKDNWSKHFEDEYPAADPESAVHDYFYGGVVEDANLIMGEYIVDEEG